MLNACVSGPSSLRTHLLEHWLHVGGFSTYLVFSQPYNESNCDWLRNALFTDNGLDLFALLHIPIAGVNNVNR